MLHNILPCICCKTNKDLGRGARIPVMYHSNLNHADLEVTSKSFHPSPTGSSCYTFLGLI